MKRTVKIFFLLFVCVVVVRAQSSSPTLTVTVKTHTGDCQLGSAAVHVEGGSPPYTIHWSNGALGDTISSLNAGNYSLEIVDSGNYDTTITFSIDPAVCKVSFNNRFTPNGDGINDTWGTGAHFNDYPKFLLQVYDRWGQIVHEQRNTYTPWDGTHLGAKVPDATYYYIFFYEEGKTKNYERGDLTIVR